MIFQIKEKFWSWGTDYTITDENGTPYYQVKGKAFSWGNDLSFQDAYGHELAFIKQTLFSWKPRYQIFIEGVPYAELIKEWSWFNKTFTLDIPGPNDYTINGSFWEHEFTFTRNNQTVATVSKQFFRLTDTYGVEVREGENPVLILLGCIVIDQMLHDDTDGDDDD